MLGSKLEISPKYLEVAKKSLEEVNKLCKVCGEPGLRVLPVTMATHIGAEYWRYLYDGFRFSPTPECPVIYYNNRTDTYFLKDEVKTRFGLKEKEPPRPLCYCLQVTEEQIADEILNKKCCFSLKDIVAYSKAGTGKWCLTTNPSGKCCRDYLGPVVDRYLEMAGAKAVQRELKMVKQHLTGEEPLKRVVLSVKGMACESCATSVSSILEKMGGMNVKVSMEKGRAELKAPTSIPDDELVAAVEDLGYNASVEEVERLA